MRNGNKFSTNASAILAVLLLTLVASNSQNVSATPNIRVQVTVKADNGLDAIVRGYLTHALRELKDITFTDIEPDFKIECVVEDNTEGCALSFVVLSNAEYLLLLISDGKSFPEWLQTFLAKRHGRCEHGEKGTNMVKKGQVE
jgi:hypothetical protein